MTNLKIHREKENFAHFGTRFVVKGVPCVADRLVATQSQRAQLLYATWDHPSGREYENATLLMVIPFLLRAHTCSGVHRTCCWMEKVQRLEREVDRLPTCRLRECVELYEHRILQLVRQYAIRHVLGHQIDNPATSKCCRDRD